ncbi:hypothetical protein [Nonomuraea sp. B1E8]|uniref:hypothetical protein n=1 Tax=unclassified Nonomuraea TaxID=2593643 RepID=UPI00325ED853
MISHRPVYGMPAGAAHSAYPEKSTSGRSRRKTSSGMPSRMSRSRMKARPPLRSWERGVKKPNM